MPLRLANATGAYLLVISFGSQAVPLASNYHIDILGFTDAEHTRNDGFTSSYASLLNQAGQVAGISTRYNGGAASVGNSTWLYQGNGRMVEIGLVGAEFTHNSVSILNDAGQVAGHTYPATAGVIAWLYNGTETINISLVDAEHIGRGGAQRSSSTHLNQAGQVAGYALRYASNGISNGQSVWLYNGASTFNISLTDAEHTGGNPDPWEFTDDYRYSMATQLNNTGQVLGYAERYKQSGALNGQSVWLYNGNETLKIGLSDAEHTRQDGYRYGEAMHLNEAGQVAGTSTRYHGMTIRGSTAWLYNGTESMNVGLTDTEHTDDNGYRESFVKDLNQAGQVVGFSTRYNQTNTFLGVSAWLYDNNATRVIGLTDAAHTDNNGYRENRVTSRLNEAGQVAGYARRFSDEGLNLGLTSWFYDGSQTREIGLTDAMHTSSDGTRYQTADTLLNEAGQVAGAAIRYNGGVGELGYTAWLYDWTLDQTFSIELSVRSDGHAVSIVHYLSEEGIALGTYDLFGEDDSLLGERAFAFSIEDGAYDLGELVRGGLEATDWEYLATAIAANDYGQILGSGLLNDATMSTMPFLLTPVTVPIPPAAWLLGSGFVGLLGFRTRRRSASANLAK